MLTVVLNEPYIFVNLSLALHYISLYYITLISLHQHLPVTILTAPSDYEVN
jgi:hypothetical protein